jgi:Rrf2 family nitric oxide-sensitive transcriptional repressor
VRLTAFTDYGLRALMRLAGAPERSFTVGEIAGEFAISRHHLLKVVRALAREGFVTAQRGAAGGIALARPASDISLGAVVRALEGRHALVECFRPDGGDCRLMPHCRLKRRLWQAREAFFRELDRSTLADCAYPAPQARAAAGVRGGRRTGALA